MDSFCKENTLTGPAPPSNNKEDPSSQASPSSIQCEEAAFPVGFAPKGPPGIPFYGVPYVSTPRRPLYPTPNIPVGLPYLVPAPAQVMGGVHYSKQSMGYDLPLSARVSHPVVATACSQASQATGSGPQDTLSTRTAAAQASVGTGEGPTVSKTPAKSKGKGSRSGHVNRREPGVSDTEVDKLTKEQLTNASVARPDRSWTDEQKVLVVKHITSPEVWKEFRSKKAIVFQELSQQALEKKKTISQVRNLWNRFWLMYKLIRRREEHTGGRDGDESTEAITEDEDEDNSSSEDDKVTRKRKRNSDKPKKTRHERFSSTQLGIFKDTVYYSMIDKVAHDDQTVVRKRAFNPAQPVSDEDESSTKKKRKKDEDSEAHSTRAALRELIAGAKERQLVTTEIARANLELARRKEERESSQADEEAKYKYATQVMQMIDHPNEKVRKIGNALADDLARKFGVQL